MTLTNKDKIRALLKSIQTGDPAPVAFVNEAKYIQHNPQTHEGSEGLAHLFKRLAATNPRVEIVRAFEDGDYVFAHTEYDFAKRNIGFEVFRFENGQAVEHWDNIQKRKGPNALGREMTDGTTKSEDHESTENNRAFIRGFVETALIGGDRSLFDNYFSENFAEYNPRLTDDVSELKSELEARGPEGLLIDYQKVHRVLAEGSFVLSVCEGYRSGVHTSFYDLFRVKDAKIAEHWDTTEEIAPKSEWKNDNGKF